MKWFLLVWAMHIGIVVAAATHAIPLWVAISAIVVSALAGIFGTRPTV